MAKHKSHARHDKAHDMPTSLDTSMPNAHLTAFLTAVRGGQSIVNSVTDFMQITFLIIAALAMLKHT